MAKGKKTGGRQKGGLNKVSAKAKENLEACFEELGGLPFLVSWAKSEPTEFFKLWGKLVPKDVEVTGEDGGPVKFVIVTGVPDADKPH